MNNLTINGNLTDDLVVKTYGEGKILGEFTIANNERYNGEERTTFLKCVMFGEKRVENLQKYLVKGCKVLLTGSLQIDRVHDEEKEYVRQYTTLIVNNLEIEKFKNEEDSKSKNYKNTKNSKYRRQ